MKKSTGLLFSVLLASLAVSTSGQVLPSATAHQPRVTAGGFGSMFQPDYAGNAVAETSPNRLYGVGAYVDYKINRWVGIEGEARWLRFNQYLGITEDTYSIGPKVPITTYKGLTPYGKFLIGTAGGSFLNGRTTALTYGGGVDYRLNSKFTLRAFDFEYQQWLVTPTLYPYGGSVGIAYRLF